MKISAILTMVIKMLSSIANNSGIDKLNMMLRSLDELVVEDEELLICSFTDNIVEVALFILLYVIMTPSAGVLGL